MHQGALPYDQGAHIWQTSCFRNALQSLASAQGNAVLPVAACCILGPIQVDKAATSPDHNVQGRQVCQAGSTRPHATEALPHARPILGPYHPPQRIILLALGDVHHPERQPDVPAQPAGL